MIKIEIEASNGAEVRQHLLALLGQTSEPAKTLPIIVDDSQVEVKDLELETVKEEVKEVVKTRTRRTKEQIAADEAAKEPAAEATGEPVAEEVNESALEENNHQATEEAPKFTAKDIQTKLVELARSGKRDNALKVLHSFGAESVTATKPLDPAKYADCMDALSKL
jgi:hypothetical protein